MKAPTKDWTGNANATFSALGCNERHNTADRQCRDYYATAPIAVDYLLAHEEISRRVLEPAAGGGHLVCALVLNGRDVKAFDIEPQAQGIERRDFLNELEPFSWDGDIVTNPPYSMSKEFIKRSLSIVKDGAKVCMFLPIHYLASQSRLELFRKSPPKRVWVFSFRINCAKNGDFAAIKGTAVDYAWFVWEKGWRGAPTIGWIERSL